MSPRTGRPPSANPRKFVRSVHFTADELEVVEAAAEAEEKPVTVFVRDAALSEASRQRRRQKPDR